MRRLFLKSIFLRIMLIAVLIWNCGAIFADTSDEYRQKQLEQSPNYYSDENQKEVAKLKQRVDEYLLIKKRLEQSPGYYTEKNQKEVAELRQRVEEYLKNNVRPGNGPDGNLLRRISFVLSGYIGQLYAN